MPHKTTNIQPFTDRERSLFELSPSPSLATSGLHRSSTVPPPKAPGLNYSPPSRKRAFLSRHARSKSANMTGSMASAVMPQIALPPTSAPRKPAPPMLRSSSLPSVPTIAEGEVQYSVTTTPPTPTTPPAIHQRPTLNRSRSSSPTRGSLSPGLTPRSSYHPGSSFYSSPTTSRRSPSPPASLVNEPFMPYSSYSFSSASSSAPSTPTSTRSRSPSISSLETIPDTPDEEAEALESEKKDAAVRAAAKKKMEEEERENGPRRSPDGSKEWGLGIGVRRVGSTDKRKRWSVCGAEKRADLELETIWEEAMAGAGIPDSSASMTSAASMKSSASMRSSASMQDVEESVEDEDYEDIEEAERNQAGDEDGDVEMVL